MNYTIREMQQADGPKVLSIFEEGIAGGNATFDREAPNWEAWNQKFLPCCRLVAEGENGEVLGWAALQSISKRDCFSGVAEVSIYLTSSAQGKGIGLNLLQKLIEESESHNFWMLQSGIFPENEASISLHKRLGFRIVGTREKIGKMNGKWRDIIFLERRSHLAQFLI